MRATPLRDAAMFSVTAVLALAITAKHPCICVGDDENTGFADTDAFLL